MRGACVTRDACSVSIVRANNFLSCISPMYIQIHHSPDVIFVITVQE
uniref:Uncharacterized protein n=1 Tax=Arundo donax TaxID=35708 RepID=A0A0A9G9A3_ARUDO